VEFERTAFELGNISVSTFALLVVLAFGVGGGVTLWRLRYQDGAVGNVLLLLTWVIVLGVVFGRLFYVLTPPPSVAAYYDRTWYGQHLLDLQVGPLAFWSGGLGSGGFAVGGLLAFGWITWRHKLDAARWADAMIVGLLSGLAIAPLGNFLSGLMFGPPTMLPWGMTLGERFAPYDDLARYPVSMRFQPTPVTFVLLAMLILAAVLIIERRWQDHRTTGNLFLLGWGAYSAGAAVLGGWQADVSRGLLNLSGLQGVMLLMALASLGILLWERTGKRDRL